MTWKLIFLNRQVAQLTWSALALLALSACASDPVIPKLEPLPASAVKFGVQQVWRAQLGSLKFPLSVSANAASVTVADDYGNVVALNPQTGAAQWQAALKTELSAGVGSDGAITAVVSSQGEVIALLHGKEIWRQKITAQSYTPPLVAGQRVFVLGTDRSVSAFDAQTGAPLWSQKKPGEALVLRQAGVLLAVGNTLVSGNSGRFQAMNPNTGDTVWETPVATPRGLNDVERMVDLVGGTTRQDTVICARAFRAAVGCVDTKTTKQVWTQASVGIDGVAADDTKLYGTESDGSIVAWKLTNGERAWRNTRLQGHELSTPLVVGSTLMVGDSAGWVHIMSRDDGAEYNRINLDGSPLMAKPVLVDKTVIFVTQKGGVYGYRPN